MMNWLDAGFQMFMLLFCMAIIIVVVLTVAVIIRAIVYRIKYPADELYQRLVALEKRVEKLENETITKKE